MHTADATTQATILSYFPERIQVALRAYSTEINLPPETVVQLAIEYFLESADINFETNTQDSPNGSSSHGVLAHLPISIQRGTQQYATEYEFPIEFVVEMAVTFLLDPDASSFEDCQVGVQKEQLYLLQQYHKAHQVQAA